MPRRTDSPGCRWVLWLSWPLAAWPAVARGQEAIPSPPTAPAPATPAEALPGGQGSQNAATAGGGSKAAGGDPTTCSGCGPRSTSDPESVLGREVGQSDDQEADGEVRHHERDQCRRGDRNTA